MTQYWVVNNSPPGSGPGGAAYTSYAIVRGSFSQAEAIPNAGGISGPYTTLSKAYSVYKKEPGNADVSTITTIGQALGAGVGQAIYSGQPSAIVSNAATGGDIATNAIPGLTDIGDFFHRLTEASTWVRVGEVAFGAIILWAGIKALSSQTAVGDAAKSVKNVAKKPVKAAVTVAAPEARLGARVAAKKVAPKTTARVASHRAQVKQYGGKKPRYSS